MPGLGPGAPEQPVYLVGGDIRQGKPVVCGVWLSHYSPTDTDEQRIRRSVEDLLAYPAAPGHWPFGATVKREYTMIPPATRLVGFQLRRDYIVIDLSREARELSKACRYLPFLLGDGGRAVATDRLAGPMALAQVVLTATETRPALGVQVLIEGESQVLWGASAPMASTAGTVYRSDLAREFVVLGRRGEPLGPRPLPTTADPTDAR
jgi:hypothetical protein